MVGVGGSGLGVVWGAGRLSVSMASRVVVDGRGVVGAVFGLLSQGEADRLVARLAVWDDPVDTVVEVPWAAVALRVDGSLAVTCSTMLPSGLFWSVDSSAPGGEVVLVGTDPGWVVRSRCGSTSLDEKYVRDFALLHVSVERTPYEQVSRSAAGDTLVWSSPVGRPVVRQWCGPRVWGDPTVEGPGVVDLYRETFDGVVAGLMERAGPLVSSVSGGLDSTFVVASLARQTSVDRPVRAFINAPLSEAGLGPVGNGDPDETGLARLLERRYPGRVTVTQILNSDMIQPLDAAQKTADAAWLPAIDPGNSVWWQDLQTRSSQLEAKLQFVGTNGDAAFSHDHAYSADYYLRAGRPFRAASMALPARNYGQSVPRATYRRAVRPVLARHRRERLWRRDYTSPLGLPAGVFPDRKGGDGRAGYLDWLSGRGTTLTASRNPASFEQATACDPFRARTVLDLAASISPSEWQRGDAPRAFARRAAEGRLPDQIRMRTRWGVTAADRWFWIRDQHDRYVSEAEQLRSTPALAGWIDHDHFERHVRQLPWGSLEPVASDSLLLIDRMLSLGAFVRTTARRIALPR